MSQVQFLPPQFSKRCALTRIEIPGEVIVMFTGFILLLIIFISSFYSVGAESSARYKQFRSDQQSQSIAIAISDLCENEMIFAETDTCE